jgi:hypothetical protein
MGLFDKKEEYSREKYDQLKNNADVAYNAARFRGTIKKRMSEEERQNIYDTIWRYSDDADKKLKKFYEKGKEEAIALNEEYDRLVVEAREAIEAVANFEKENLGMHKEDSNSSKEEIEEKL